MNTKIVIALCCAFFILFATTSKATPSYSKQTGKNCSSCHTAFPQLNKKGRTFKELGYRFPEQVGLYANDFVESENIFSALVVARPYDKKDSGDQKTRALHEVELFVTAPISRKFSAFAEVEYEDEIDDSFGQELAAAVLTYHHNTEFNVQMNWGDPLWADPYGFLSDHFRLTRGHMSVVDQAGNDGTLRSNRQNVTAYGRVAEKLFYIVSHAGESDDAEGVEADYWVGRLAFDITPDAMIGGFIKDGESKSTSPSMESSIYGLDFQVDAGNTRISGAYGMLEDSTVMGPDVENDVYSLQAFHTFENESGRPTWVPLIRFDSYEKADGMEEFEELTLNLTYYYEENIKILAEYWDQLDVPSGKDEDDRFTIQISVGF